MALLARLCQQANCTLIARTGLQPHLVKPRGGTVHGVACGRAGLSTDVDHVHAGNQRWDDVGSQVAERKRVTAGPAGAGALAGAMHALSGG